MSMEDPDTIEKCFDALSRLIRNHGPPEIDGHAVLDACVVLGTWVRVLEDSKVSPVDQQPLNQHARAAVQEFRGALAQQNARGWAKTIQTIDELLQRAEQQKKKVAAR